MLHDPARLEAALAPLIGLPLIASNRALDVQMFSFGETRVVTWNAGPRKGQPKEVGEYALHIQCAWRVRGPSGIVVGSKDRVYQPGPDPLAETDDESRGPTRCEERMQPWIDAGPYLVEAVAADAVGGLQVSLAGGFVLEAFPDNSLDGEYSEQWRVFQPATEQAHFVVSGDGIDDEH